MDHFPDGGFSLSFEAEHHPWSDLDVAPSETTGLRMVLPRGAHITGTVQSPDGSARGDLTIEFRLSAAKTATYEDTGSDGKTKTIVYYEGSEWAWADESGGLDEWIKPGKYIGYWKDKAGRRHRLGTWNFEATQTYELTIVLPAK